MPKRSPLRPNYQVRYVLPLEELGALREGSVTGHGLKLHFDLSDHLASSAVSTNLRDTTSYLGSTTASDVV
jgi:hypothetical protein